MAFPLNQRTSLWARRRHLSQLFFSLLFCLAPLSLPWIPGLEQGLLKVNFETWRVHFFSFTLVPGTLHVISLAIIFLLLCITLMATLYGKVFCGWACPQNILFESFEAIHHSLKKRYPFYRKRPSLQKGLDFFMAITAAAVITWVANQYFIGASPIFRWAMSLFLMGFVTLEAYWLKHDFCRTACPYAFLQQSFNDKSSLHIHWESQRPGAPCGSCTACEKACYVDLDIKKDTFSIDCTLCGACVDACEKVYSRSSEPSLLSFQFGEEASPSSWNILGINQLRKLFVVLTWLTFTLFFLWTLFTLPMVKFRVDYPLGGSRESQLPFLEEGKWVNRYTLRLSNLTEQAHTYKIQVDPQFRYTWEEERGEEISLSSFEQKTLPLQLQWKEQPDPLPFLTPVSFSLFDEQGKEVARRELYFKSR